MDIPIINAAELSGGHVNDPETMRAIAGGFLNSIRLNHGDDVAKAAGVAMLSGIVDFLSATEVIASGPHETEKSLSEAFARGLEETAAALRARGIVGAAITDGMTAN